MQVCILKNYWKESNLKEHNTLRSKKYIKNIVKQRKNEWSKGNVVMKIKNCHLMKVSIAKSLPAFNEEAWENKVYYSLLLINNGRVPCSEVKTIKY